MIGFGFVHFTGVWRRLAAPKPLQQVQQRRLQVDAVLTAVTINACRDRWQQVRTIKTLVGNHHVLFL